MFNRELMLNCILVSVNHIYHTVSKYGVIVVGTDSNNTSAEDWYTYTFCNLKTDDTVINIPKIYKYQNLLTWWNTKCQY